VSRTIAAELAEVVWVDRSDAEQSRPEIRGDLYNPRLSQDGRRLVIDMSSQETNGDIWVFDLARGSSRRPTHDPIDESRPTWTASTSRGRPSRSGSTRPEPEGGLRRASRRRELAGLAPRDRREGRAFGAGYSR